MELYKQESAPESKDDGIQKRPGQLPDIGRKEGSGRVRIVERNPDILEAVTSFAESAGVAAHGRRREETGFFGFTMTNVRDYIKEKIFNGSEVNLPSVKTFRRMFEGILIF